METEFENKHSHIIFGKRKQNVLPFKMFVKILLLFVINVSNSKIRNSVDNRFNLELEHSRLTVGALVVEVTAAFAEGCYPDDHMDFVIVSSFANGSASFDDCCFVLDYSNRCYDCCSSDCCGNLDCQNHG